MSAVVSPSAHERQTEWLTRRLAAGVTPARLLLGAILLLAAVLSFANFSAIGDSNQYYTAAVESMLDSWHNFFYVAAEPGGSVSVDKPPLGLWVQALSAALFGVSGWATVLPNILAGFGSIVVVYRLVKPRISTGAALLAAFVVAVTPVAVAAQRNNTTDSLLTLVLLLAAWGFLRATESGRTRYVWLGALLVGLGFMIKMLQAYLLLPALFALYWLGGTAGFGRKIAHLTGAAAIIVAVSLWWPVAVDLTPADQRPYVGSSSNNTVLELIVGHNGVRRLVGGGGADGAVRPNSPPGSAGDAPQPPDLTSAAAALGVSADELSAALGMPPDVQRAAETLGVPLAELVSVLPAPPGGGRGDSADGRPGAAPSGGAPGAPGGAPGGPDEVGTAGVLRFASAPLGKELSWLLPPALVGMALLAVGGPLTWPLDNRRRLLVLFGGWLATGLVFFSIAGFFHAYYLIMLAPPLGVLVSAAVDDLWRRRHDRRGRLGLALTGGATLLFQWWLAAQFGAVGWWLTAALAVAAVAGTMLVVGSRRAAAVAAPLLIAALLVTPTAWSWLTNQYSVSAVLPGAYRGTMTDSVPGAGRGGEGSVDEAVLAHVAARTEDMPYLMAVSSSMIGAPYVLATQRPVLYMGGFNGSDPVVDADDMAALVADGSLRFVLVGGGQAGGNAQSDVDGWVAANCAVVDGVGSGARLYDCAPAPGGAEG